MLRVALCVWCLLIAACGSLPQQPVTAAPQAIGFWHWNRGRSLSAREVDQLQRLQVDLIGYWAGSIVRGAQGLRFETRGGAVAGSDAIARCAVLRIDDSCHAALASTEQAAELVALIKRHCTDERALQIDWDVPHRLLPDYARLLRAVRTARGPEAGALSATCLVSDLTQPGFAAVCSQLNEVVVQCYHDSQPAWDAKRLIAQTDPLSLLPHLEALPCGYRIGLASFEQTSVFDQAGRCLRSIVPVRLEALLGPDFAQLDTHHGDTEVVTRFRLLGARSVSGHHFPAGTQFAHSRIRSESIQAFRAALVQAQPQRCRGVMLFRLQAPGGQAVVSLQALLGDDRAVPAGEAEGAMLSCRQTSDPSELLIEAATGSIWPEAPGSLLVPYPPERLRGVPAHVRTIGQHAGLTVSRHRATSTLVRVPLLRAGTTLRLQLTTTDPTGSVP
ncbi:MAG: DUF3142 domain-containing protein [Planctomycetota bacterium]|jgi:hypothetical protein|nr:DUF3142 domain-containing protein [Planctomycetota bacterium]